MEYQKALSKCMQICSRKEYCVLDIEQKLSTWEVGKNEMKEVITALKAEKFIDEERYVRAFVNDKFKFNHWGRIKIAYHLKQKRIEGSLIRKIIDAINTDEYTELMNSEISNKIKKVKANSTYERNCKVVSYMASKGFEPDLVFKLLDDFK